MENTIELIITNWEISITVGGLILGLIDYTVKKTKNKTDDAIWTKIKTPIVNLVKDYFESKKNKTKTEDKEVK